MLVRIEERMASFICVVAVVDDSIRMIEKINGHEKALVGLASMRSRHNMSTQAKDLLQAEFKIRRERSR